MSEFAQSNQFEPLGLVDALQGLPTDELNELALRLRIPLDPTKRISVETQLARGLVALPHAREPAHLSSSQVELLLRVAEKPAGLALPDVPQVATELAELGLVFSLALTDGRVLLRLPLAYLVQLKTWHGEDPRSVRALLSQTSQEVSATVAAEYLGRPPTRPTSLALEPALRALLSPDAIREQVATLSSAERNLLLAVDEQGGEVDTAELLDLEKEPLRLRVAGLAAHSRKGVGFALERRGFLIPIHPNHHRIPTEVARVIGAARRVAREESRRAIVRSVLAEDHAPTRATFARDPAPLALAFVFTLKEQKKALRLDRGTPKSFITKLATLHGCSPDAAAMIAALSRASGYWATGTDASTSPLNEVCFGQLGEHLFSTWRKGGAWDEAREHGELLRLASGSREASAVGVIRELVLEALSELGEGRWVPWESIVGYVLSDKSHESLTRLLDRWARRSEQPEVTVAEVATRIGLDSLFVLGVVDVGEEEEGSTSGPALRLTPRGKRWLSAAAPSAPGAASVFLEGPTLRVGEGARVWEILALAPLVTVARADSLELAVTPAKLTAQIAGGATVAELKQRLNSVAPVSESVERLLEQASAVVGTAELVSCSGFLWVDDSELRELLRARRGTSELFLDPSPVGGLLLKPGVSAEQVILRSRRLGVAVSDGGSVLRAEYGAPHRTVTKNTKKSRSKRVSRQKREV